MKLIIDIPEQIYQNAKDDMLCGSEIIVDAIKNGIPQETITEFADRCKECGARYGRLLQQEPKTDGDCISRQAVLDALRKMMQPCGDGLSIYDQGNFIHNETLADVHQTVEELPSVNPQEPKEWIPVSERLPKENGRYLVTMRYSTPDTIQVVGYTNNLYEVDEYDFVDCKRSGWYGYDSEYGFFEHDNVGAWMPLPEPYKESEVSE